MSLNLQMNLPRTASPACTLTVAFGRQVLPVLVICATAFASAQHGSDPQTQQEDSTVARQAREMFMFGFSNYMRHAFPMDDLRPISCGGHNTQGGIANTLIDSLDALMVRRSHERLIQ